MLMRKTAWLALTVVLGSGERGLAQAPAQKATQPKASAAAKTGTSGQKTATDASTAYDPALLQPDTLTAKAPAHYQVRFVTTQGVFTVSVTRAWAPLGADRFYNLIRHHYYDKASFFRVVPNFVVQFGINAYPPVSAAWKGAKIQDDAVTQSNKKGFLTFATAGPNTRTTQIFINLVDNERLDKMGFAPFAVVDGEGMGIVEKLYQGYGENGPDQGQLEAEGKLYVDSNFAKLDSIKTARVVPAARPGTARTAAKPAAPKP